MSDNGSELRLHQAEVPESLAGKRLDQALASLFPDYSRSRLKSWVEQGLVHVDGKQMRPRDKLAGGESIELTAQIEQEVPLAPEPIDLDIVYEDDDILVINKPVGLVVHPGAGNANGTLVNGLLHYRPEQEQLPRAGIVHRLDKDTSGLMVVAKSQRAHTSLVAQLQARSVKREYLAVVQGSFTGGGTVDAPMARHSKDRKKQTVWPTGKKAVTHYRIAERFRGHTLLAVTLETGRTHQIRVHMAHIRHPLVGDQTYGGRVKLPAKADEEVVDILRNFPRQALHARRLGLNHPESGKRLSWQRPMPDDMQELVDILRDDAEMATWSADRDEMEVVYVSDDEIPDQS